MNRSFESPTDPKSPPGPTGPHSRETLDTLARLLRRSRVAMMTTLTPEGQLKSRPMARIDRKFDGQLWFLTDRRAGKVEEVEKRPDVSLTFSDPGEGLYVSLSGRAGILTDRAPIQDVWNEAFERWLADDVKEDDLVILRVRVEHAEYWDDSTHVMRDLGEWVRRVFTGEKDASSQETEHGEVDLSR